MQIRISEWQCSSPRNLVDVRFSGIIISESLKYNLQKYFLLDKASYSFLLTQLSFIFSGSSLIYENWLAHLQACSGYSIN